MGGGEVWGREAKARKEPDKRPQHSINTLHVKKLHRVPRAGRVQRKHKTKQKHHCEPGKETRPHMEQQKAKETRKNTIRREGIGTERENRNRSKSGETENETRRNETKTGTDGTRCRRFPLQHGKQVKGVMVRRSESERVERGFKRHGATRRNERGGKVWPSNGGEAAGAHGAGQTRQRGR